MVEFRNVSQRNKAGDGSYTRGGGQGKATEFIIQGFKMELKVIEERLRVGVMTVNLEVSASDRVCQYPEDVTRAGKRLHDRLDRDRGYIVIGFSPRNPSRSGQKLEEQEEVMHYINSYDRCVAIDSLEHLEHLRNTYWNETAGTQRTGWKTR